MESKVMSSEKYGKVRCLIKDTERAYVAADLADVIGYARPDTLVKHYAAKDDTVKELVAPIGGGAKRKMLLVTENGLRSILKAVAPREAQDILAWLLEEPIEPAPEGNLFASEDTLPLEVSGKVAYVDNDNIAWFNAEFVARGLGFVQVHKERVTESCYTYSAVRWETVNRYLAEFGYDKKVGKDDFLPENMFYRLAMKANNETAVNFQMKIANEILPSIRKDGSYSTKEASANMTAKLNNLKAENTLLRNQLPSAVTFELAVVYVLLMSNGSIKIGMTDCLTRRIKEIEKESGLQVLNYESTKFLPREAAAELEQSLKVRFAADCLGGEFFSTKFTIVAALLNL